MQQLVFCFFKHKWKLIDTGILRTDNRSKDKMGKVYECQRCGKQKSVFSNIRR